MNKVFQELPSCAFFPEYSKLHELKEKKLKKFKVEVKCEKALSSYLEAFFEFEKDLQLHSEPSQLLSRIKIIRAKRSELNLIFYLIPKNFKQVLQEQEKALNETEVALLCENSRVKEDISKEAPCKLWQKARNLEEEIDLSLLYQEEEFPKEWLNIFISKIERAHQLYQQAEDLGDISALAEAQRTALILDLFKDFRKSLNSLGHRYALNILFDEAIKYPLCYLDPRLPLIFRFYNQIATFEKKEIFEKARVFIRECMNLPINDLSLLLLQMGNDMIHSDLFTDRSGESDEDEIDLREKKLECFLKIAKSLKGCSLPECKDLPKKLNLNKNIGQHPRIKFMRYAYTMGVSFEGRLEWHIDLMMAKLRENSLDEIVDSYKSLKKDEKAHLLGYILRQRANNLGLFLQPKAEIGYDFAKIEKRRMRLLELPGLKDRLYKSLDGPMSKEKMISHLLASPDLMLISSLFKDRLTQQGIEEATLNAYFETDGRLSEEGACALLFGLGYLKEKK